MALTNSAECLVVGIDCRIWRYETAEVQINPHSVRKYLADAGEDDPDPNCAFIPDSPGTMAFTGIVAAGTTLGF
jgi:hypothetical protein